MSAQPFRTGDGGLIDRSRTLNFTFDGASYTGHPGDTLASALLANGVHLVGRSFKYHRPRGIMTAGSHEPSALVELRDNGRREPNTKATTVPLHAGLLARSQNRWPSLKYDFLSVNQWFAPFLVAGFYYKTFKWPASFWEPVYERVIRRAAGLGRVAKSNDPDHYERAHLYCDLLIIGGGVTGLMAAKAAARSGLRVVLADDGTRFGGQALGEAATRIDRLPALDWINETIGALEQAPNVTLLTETSVFGRYDAGSYGALQVCDSGAAVPAAFTPRQIYHRIHTRRALLASGATERPVVVAGNDRPGVMLASAARTYANRYGVRCGARVVVFGNSDDIYQTALDLEAAGVSVPVIVDARPASEAARAAGRKLSARVRFASVVEAIHGDKRVSSVDVRNADLAVGPAGETVSCDTVCISGGWNANFHLATHRGLPAHFDAQLQSFKTARSDDELTIAGAAQCHWSTADCLADGLTAALEAITALNGAPVAMAAPKAQDGLLGNLTPLHRVTNELSGKADKAFVDYQHDVTDTDLGLAVREGYDHAEHAKRYTTLGMATDQGKMGHVNGAALLAQAQGKQPQEVGTSRARPPVSPVTIGALAGHGAGKGFMPIRLTPMHDWHARHQATFVEAGLWYRPQFYRQPGEETWLDSAKREAHAVRTSVGISDVSSLGKIDIQGADATAFINRVYTNNWLKLPVGKARYGLMLREDGFVLDDGTTARLAENHYIMTTTTVNAAKVMAHLEYCADVLWPDLDVHLQSITDQWAQMAVAGPNARDVLGGVVDDGFDLANEAFPFMAAGELTVAGGIAARLFRISFSGELAYEVAVPAGHGMAAWEALLEAGKAHAITPYGLEALNILRVEKGHVTGAELDGRTTVADIGLGQMLNLKKDAIGGALAQRPALIDDARPRLVGVRCASRPWEGANGNARSDNHGESNGAGTGTGTSGSSANTTGSGGRQASPERPKLLAGAHLLLPTGPRNGETDQGWLSSVAYSVELDEWVGLAFLKHGPERHGEKLIAADYLRGSEIEVEICAPVFVDPAGERHHG